MAKPMKTFELHYPMIQFLKYNTKYIIHNRCPPPPLPPSTPTLLKRNPQKFAGIILS